MVVRAQFVLGCATTVPYMAVLPGPQRTMPGAMTCAVPHPPRDDSARSGFASRESLLCISELETSHTTEHVFD
jgi:hypothetical protein